MATAADQLRKLAGRASTFGASVLDDGTEVFGKTPDVGTEAWLHVLFPGLSAAELAKLEVELGTPVPDPYAFFLRKINGAHLFSATLSLAGLQRVHSRLPGNRQPFDLRTANVGERPSDAPPDAFFFGFYDWNGSQLYLDGGDRVVYAQPNSAEPLLIWDSLDVALVSEVERLSAHFDERGRQLDPDRPTTPATVA